MICGIAPGLPESRLCSSSCGVRQSRARYRQLEELTHLDELALELDSHVSGLSNRGHRKHHLLLEVCGLLLILLNGTQRLSDDAAQQARDRVEPDRHHGAARIESKLAAGLAREQRDHDGQTAYRDHCVPEELSKVRESMGDFIFELLMDELELAGSGSKDFASLWRSA